MDYVELTIEVFAGHRKKKHKGLSRNARKKQFNDCCLFKRKKFYLGQVPKPRYSYKAKKITPSDEKMSGKAGEGTLFEKDCGE